MTNEHVVVLFATMIFFIGLGVVLVGLSLERIDRERRRTIERQDAALRMLIHKVYAPERVSEVLSSFDL